jgi:hypothetical protein
MNLLQQCLEAVPVVGNREHIGQNFALRAEDEAVMLVLCHINSNANDDNTSRMKIYDAASTELFALYTR